MSDAIDAMLSQSLRFEYQYAGITPLKYAHSTGWRTQPALMFSQAHRGGEAITLKNGTSVEARNGELIVLPAGVWHEVRVITPKEIRRWVHVNYFVLGHLDLCSLLHIPLRIEHKLGGQIGNLIEQWLETSAGMTADKAPLLHALRNEFGFKLLAMLSGVTRWRLGATAKIEGTRRLAPVLEQMNRNFERPLRRDELARLAGLSPAQFHIVFKETTGATPGVFLREIRIRNAQQLLISTESPVKAIAGACGFDDPFVFSKCFKRTCGVSPHEYRLHFARAHFGR